jgi:hypothetical protein
MQPCKRLFRAITRRLAQSTITFFSLFGSVRNNARTNGLSLTAVDKRQHRRIQLVDTTVQVTDGCIAATARIDNISPQGICLRNLPEHLYLSAEQLTVFSSDNPGIPILHITPRWHTNNWNGKTIGAAIVNVSSTWRLFLAHAAEQLTS